MKKMLMIGVVAAGALGALAATKTWPENYWASMVAAEAAQRPAAATLSLQLEAADADVVSAEKGVSELDTFLCSLFESSNALLGFSTMPNGFAIFLR